VHFCARDWKQQTERCRHVMRWRTFPKISSKIGPNAVSCNPPRVCVRLAPALILPPSLSHSLTLLNLGPSLSLLLSVAKGHTLYFPLLIPSPYTHNSFFVTSSFVSVLRALLSPLFRISFGFHPQFLSERLSSRPCIIASLHCLDYLLALRQDEAV
jgi:hypothetical protein